MRGRLGPSYDETQASTGFGSGTAAWFNSRNVYNVINGIQYVQIWTSGYYLFTVAGAGASSFSGGHGAVVQGGFFLSAGQIVAVLVGQQPEANAVGQGGGAGGSFVALISNSGAAMSLASSGASSSLSNAVPLFVAGGAGGGNGANANAVLTTTAANGPGTRAGGAYGSGGDVGATCGGGGFFRDAVGAANGAITSQPGDFFCLDFTGTSAACTGGSSFVNGSAGGLFSGGWGNFGESGGFAAAARRGASAALAAVATPAAAARATAPASTERPALATGAAAAAGRTAYSPARPRRTQAVGTSF